MSALYKLLNASPNAQFVFGLLCATVLHIKWCASGWIHQKFTTPFLNNSTSQHWLYSAYGKQEKFLTHTHHLNLLAYILYTQWTFVIHDYFVCIISRGLWKRKVINSFIRDFYYITFQKYDCFFLSLGHHIVASMTTFVSFVVYVSSDYPV